MGTVAGARLLDPGEHPVTDAQSCMFSTFDDTDLGWNGARVPTIWRSERTIRHINDAQHGDLWQPAALVECPPGPSLQRPIIRHVAQQRFQCDLVRAVQAKRLGDLALPDRGWRAGNQLQDISGGG